MEELTYILAVIVGVLVMSTAVYAAVYGMIALMLWAMGVHRKAEPLPVSATAFPVIPIDNGAGSYVVCGVRKETREDYRQTIHADSRANAVVKAELDGVVVTRVEKVSP